MTHSDSSSYSGCNPKFVLGCFGHGFLVSYHQPFCFENGSAYSTLGKNWYHQVDPAQLQLFCEVTWFLDQLDTENSTWASVKAMAWEKGGRGGHHFFFFVGNERGEGRSCFFPLAWMCRVFFLAGSLDSSKATWSGQIDRSGIFEVLFWKLDHWELWNCWISPTLMLPFPIVLHDRFVGKVPIYLVAFLCMVVCVCFPRNGCKKERRQETITLDDKERFFLRHFLEGSVHGFWAAWTQWLHMVQSLQLKSELLLVFSKWKLLGNPTSKIKIFQNLSCFFSKLSDFGKLPWFFPPNAPSGGFTSRLRRWRAACRSCRSTRRPRNCRCGVSARGEWDENFLIIGKI